MRLREFLSCVNPDEEFLLEAQGVTKDLDIKKKYTGVVTERNIPVEYRNYLLFWCGVCTNGDKPMLRIIAVKDFKEGVDDSCIGKRN